MVQQWKAILYCPTSINPECNKPLGNFYVWNWYLFYFYIKPLGSIWRFHHCTDSLVILYSVHFMFFFLVCLCYSNWLETGSFKIFSMFWGCSCSCVWMDVMPVFSVFICKLLITFCVICVNCGHLDPVVWCIVKLQPVLPKWWSCLWSDDVLLSFLDIIPFWILTILTILIVLPVKFYVFSYWLCIFP